MASRKSWIKQMEENPLPRAIREFTDRDELRAAYHNMVQRCKTETEESNNCYVINYHGVGGIGKTTLLRKLQSEIEEKCGKRVDKNYIILNLDFETIEPDSVSALVSLRRQLIQHRPNLQFPMFDEAVGKLRRSNAVVDDATGTSILEKKPLVNDVVDAVSEFVPGMNAVKIGFQRAEKTLRGFQRRAATDFDYLERMETHDEARIIKSLPYCFAHDVNYGLPNDDALLLFFIDTYERLVTEAEGSSRWTPSMQTDDWLCGSRGLIRNLPSSVFAIAGREQLKWKDYDAYWKDNLETHVIDHLSEEDSNFFFSKCGIDSTLWHGLYTLTGGEPVFMDLCVDQYEDIVHSHSISGESGYVPGIEEFGENTSILVERHTRYVGEDMRDALYIAASMRKWDQETLHCAAEALNISIQPVQFKRLCSLSYVSTDDGKLFYMHSIIADILSKNLGLEERKTAIEALIKYSEKHLDQEWIMESISETARKDALSQIVITHAMVIANYAYKKTNKYDQAIKWYLFALDSYQKHMEWDGADDGIANASNQLGNLYKNTGRMTEAEAEYLRAKEIREQLASENPGAYLPVLASTCNNLGVLYKNTGRMTEAEAEYLRAKEIREQLALENPEAYLRGVAMTCNNLGILYWKTGRMTEAEVETLRAKEICEKQASENPEAYLPDLATTYDNLGVLYRGTGRMQEAETEHVRAKETREQLASENPGAYLPDLAMTCNNLGILYWKTGRMTEAETEYLRAKEIWEHPASGNPEAYLPDVAKTCNNLGNLYKNRGRMTEAEAEYLRAKEIYEQITSETPGAYLPDLAMTCNNLGILYKDVKRIEEAEAEYLRAKEIWEQLASKTPGAYLRDVAMTCNNLGNLYSDTGRMQKAEAEYLRAKEIREKLAEKHPRAYLPGLIRVYSNLIILYGKEMGEEERAMPLREKKAALQAQLDALNGKEE